MTDKRKRGAAVLAALAAVLAWVTAARVELREALGAVLIVWGVALWSAPVALIVAGIAVLLTVHRIPVRWRQ